MINFRKIIGYYSLEYPALDVTTSFYEFLSYQECCWSLKVEPSITKFTRYNNYYRSISHDKIHISKTKS